METADVRNVSYQQQRGEAAPDRGAGPDAAASGLILPLTARLPDSMQAWSLSAAAMSGKRMIFDRRNGRQTTTCSLAFPEITKRLTAQAGAAA